MPPSTIVAEPAVVKIEKNIDRDRRRVVGAFVEYLWSREAQQLLVDSGFESVYEELNAPRAALEAIADPFTLADMGGLEARAKILEGGWRAKAAGQLRR